MNYLFFFFFKLKPLLDSRAWELSGLKLCLPSCASCMSGAESSARSLQPWKLDWDGEAIAGMANSLWHKALPHHRRVSVPLLECPSCLVSGFPEGWWSQGEQWGSSVSSDLASADPCAHFCGIVLCGSTHREEGSAFALWRLAYFKATKVHVAPSPLFLCLPWIPQREHTIISLTRSHW